MKKEEQKKPDVPQDAQPQELPRMDAGEMGLLLDYSFQGGIDLQGRNLLIQGEIDEKTVALVHAFLGEVEVVPEPATFYINSPGGDLAAVSSIIARMRMSLLGNNCPVNTIGLGEVASAAFLLLAAGKNRVVTEETSAMIHAFSYGHGGDLPSHEAIAEETARRSEFWSKWLAKRSKKGVKYWREAMSGGDQYFSTEELFKIGIIDAVI